MTSTYMTAEQLGITPEEHAALVTLSQTMFGFPFQERVPQERKVAGNAEAGVRFNMNFPSIAATHCGTVACLGGHVSLLLQGIEVGDLPNLATTPEQRDAMDSYVQSFEPDGPGTRSPLAELYYPLCGLAYAAPPWVAARAVVNFLTTGESRWTDICLDRDPVGTPPTGRGSYA